MTSRPDPRVGTTLGPYRIERVIGRGGMGVVYLGEQISLGRKVALKVLAPDLVDEEAFRQRFVRESQMAAAIDHPNILPVYEAGEIEGTYFLAMRYVEGTDLDSRLRAGALEPRETIQLLGQVASALDAAAEAGLVHRDVKPANVLIASGKGVERADHAYLTDFGLTKHRGSQSGLTQSGAFMGTLDYIAPEQVEGRDVDGRTDQYSLACVAFHCLTGRTPFPRDTDIAIAMAQLHEAPPSVVALRPELPVEVDAVVARGMAKKPEDRYPTSEAFISALRNSLGIRPSEPHAILVPVARSRRPALAAALVVVAVLGVAAAAFVIGGRGTSGPSPSASTGAGGPFPDAAEAALIARLPADLRAGCARGSYGAQPTYEQANSSAAGIPDPAASVVCTAPPGSRVGPVSVQAYPDSPATSDFLRDRLDDVANQVGDVLPGDCATRPTAQGRWANGKVLCFQLAQYPRAWIYWTDPAIGLLGAASREDLDSASLYDWWLASTPVIHSGSGGASASATAKSAAFPTTDEVRLIAAIPAELAADCQRGDGRTLPANIGSTTTLATLKPRAHIDCRLPGGAGPDRIEGFNVLNSAERAAWNVIVGLALEQRVQVPTEHEPPQATCAEGGPDLVTWPAEGEPIGLALCYTDPVTGDAVIAWSDYAWTVYRAVAASGDRKALLDWWTDNADRLIPPARP